MKKTGFGLLVVLLQNLALLHAQETIRLGVTAPLSGDFATYGKHIQEGADLAVQDLANQNIAVEMFYEDACLPTAELSALHKLVTVNHVQGLAANYCIIGIMAAQSFLRKNDLVAFQTSESPQALMLEDGNIFSTYPLISTEAKRLAKFTIEETQARSASILHLTTQWGEEYQQHFQKEFKHLGGRVLDSITNPIGVNDFRTELIKIKASNPDILLLAHIGPTLGTAIKQAREIGIKAQIVTVNDAEDQSVLEIAGSSAEGVIFFTPQIGALASHDQFEQAFVTRFGHSPNSLSRHSYDSTILLARAVSSCKNSSICVKAKLHQAEYHGATGRIQFEADGSSTREFVRKNVRNGRFVIDQLH